MSHFLQSAAWTKFQSALGRRAISKVTPEWSYTAYLESGFGNTRLYAPYGPEFSSPESANAALASLIDEGRQYAVTFVRIEPTNHLSAQSLSDKGWRPVTYQQLNPARTQVIDLTSSEEDILAGMTQNSRNLTRNYANKGLSIHKSTDPSDITILTSLLKGVAHRNHITPHSDAYFAAQASTLMPLGAATLFYVSYENSPIAAALVYDSETTRYYAHAAADDAYRKLSAGTALVGHMILDAKRSGLGYFDLYGIAPADDSDHPWSGFTKFKQSFGGHPVDYVGAWDYPIRKLPYAFYRTYQSMRHRLR